VGLSAVNTEVWLALLAVFLVVLGFRYLRARYVRGRESLAAAIAASIRARNGRSRP
jgi:hypothetical protein